jgi:hypothetical protein
MPILGDVLRGQRGWVEIRVRLSKHLRGRAASMHGQPGGIAACEPTVTILHEQENIRHSVEQAENLFGLRGHLLAGVGMSRHASLIQTNAATVK